MPVKPQRAERFVIRLGSALAHPGPATLPDLGPREAVEELAHRLEAQVLEGDLQSVLDAIEAALDDAVREREREAFPPRHLPRRRSPEGIDPFFFG